MNETREVSQFIKHSLEAIENNAMAISGISRLIYDLKMDCEQLELEEEDKGKYPALAVFGQGLHDCDLARALEILAEDTKDHCDRITYHIIEQERIQAAAHLEGKP